MTVRKMVADIQHEIIHSTELHPTRASELLMRLTALIGNCNEQIRQSDAEYAAVLLKALETHEKANRARIHAELSPEYDARRVARDTKELCLELARSLKHYLRCVSEEMRLQK